MAERALQIEASEHSMLHLHKPKVPLSISN
jgi:hypothetical protein